MKTTDNTYNKQRDAELDQIRLERLDRIIELEAQRDAAVVALRDLLRQYKKGTCTIDTYYCNQAREAIAAAEKGTIDQ